MLISLTEEKQVKEFLGFHQPYGHIFINVDNEFQQAYFTFYINAEIVKEEFINYNLVIYYLKRNNLITKMPRWDGSYYIGKRYDEYFVIVGHHRDSGLIQESNYSSIKEFLTKNSINFIEVTSNHWLVGWIEELLIKEDDIEGIEFINDNILDRLEGYPIFNDTDFYERENIKTSEYVEMIRNDLRNKFQNTDLTYKEKKEYAKRIWHLDLGKQYILEIAMEMAGEDY